MKRVLGIVSTPYHLLMFLLLKEIYLKDCTQIDLMVTDKTQYMIDLYQSHTLEAHFQKVYFANGSAIKNPYKSSMQTFWESFIYNKTTELVLGEKLDVYDTIYFSAPHVVDEIVKEITKTAIKQNRQVSFIRYEDGFASYTKEPLPLINTSSGQKLYRLFLGYDILQKEKELYLLDPSLVEDNVQNSSFSLQKIPYTLEIMDRVTQTALQIFSVKSRSVKEKYVFLGQGTRNASLNPNTYQSIIMQIADLVGRDQFIMKPHPRGEFDHFDSTIAMYEDASPFELALANQTFRDKVFISFYSTACVSGSLLFNNQNRVIFIYPMAADSFNEKCDYEHYFEKLTKKYPHIQIAHSMEELKQLL